MPRSYKKPRRTPVRRTPKRRTPARKTPKRRTPVRRTPVRRTPARKTPARRTPARKTPKRKTPKRKTPVRRTPVRRTPVRRTPVRRTHNNGYTDLSRIPTHEILRRIKDTRYIYGMISLSEYYDTLYGKHIYTFGEIHTKNYNCNEGKSVVDYVINTLRYWESQGKTIDVFIETRFRHRKNIDIKAIGSFMTDIADILQSCLIKDNKCVFDHVRVHNMDIRGGVDTALMGLLFAPWCESDNYEGKPCEQLRKYINKLSDLQGGDKIYISDIIGQDIMQRILKQLNNIKYEDIKNELVSLFETNVKSIYITKDEIKDPNFFKKMVTIIADFGVWLVDMYTLARLYRTFKDGTFVSNAIIIGGQMHIDHYNKFFESLSKVKTIHKEHDNVNRCISLSGFTQPLFS